MIGTNMDSRDYLDMPDDVCAQLDAWLDAVYETWEHDLIIGLGFGEGHITVTRLARPVRVDAMDAFFKLDAPFVVRCSTPPPRSVLRWLRERSREDGAS